MANLRERDLSPRARQLVALAEIRDGVKSQPVRAKAAKSAAGSELEMSLVRQCRYAGLPEPTVQHRFAPPRRWRWDLAWLAEMVAVEVQGGTWAGGRHVRGGGYAEDAEKSNAGVVMGWRLLRFDAAMVNDGRAVETIRAVLTGGNSA